MMGPPERGCRVTTVYAPGVWDLLHVGHLEFLEAAWRRGDRLVVGVPSDDVVMLDKGEPPVISLHDRIRLLEALWCVDTVAPYYALEFLTHLKLYRPGVLAVGEFWGREQRHLEAEAWARTNGCQVVRIPYYPHESTTRIRQRVQGLLCHDSPEDDYLAFCNGCDDYQRRLFGRCRSDELKAGR